MTIDSIYNQRLFGLKIGHTFGALYVFEEIFNRFPLAQIIEFGTGRGGLSMFLSVQANVRGFDYVTIDMKNKLSVDENFTRCNPPQRKKIAQYVSSHCINGSVFDDTVFKLVTGILSLKRCLLYCDNGARFKELKTYMPEIWPGSIIGVHDWGRMPSLKYDEIEAYATSLQLNPILDELLPKTKSHQRFWIKGNE